MTRADLHDHLAQLLERLYRRAELRLGVELPRGLESVAWERLSWVANICQLPTVAVEVLAALVATEQEPLLRRADDDPGTNWAALAELLGASEREVADLFAADGPLRRWSLVKVAGGDVSRVKVKVNDHITQFLFRPAPRAAAT